MSTLRDGRPTNRGSIPARSKECIPHPHKTRRPNVFLTLTHRLLVTKKGTARFPPRQGQPKTPQSVSVVWSIGTSISEKPIYQTSGPNIP